MNKVEVIYPLRAHSVLFLRPTDSSTIFIQQLGRGLRLHPGCEVLTAIDFVGHHRKAWLSFSALGDPNALPGPTTVTGLPITITPPQNCEIVLDDRTREILKKVSAFTGRKRDACVEAYQEIREELGTPPYPVDLLTRSDVPDFGDFRSVFGNWIKLRIEMGDAKPWERALEDAHPLSQLLQSCERDWQAPRVFPYALLWGAVHSPHAPEAGYEAFFGRFPRWSVEHVPPQETKVKDSLAKRLGSVWGNDGLDPRVFQVIPAEELLYQIEARLQLVLEKDYKARHGGVLRRPEELALWTRYTRSEIVNYFGAQYDPAIHNTGIIVFGNNQPFPGHIVIITKLDTSTAKETFQYSNQFLDPGCIMWQSQNKNTPETEPGRSIVVRGRASVHLFVQERSHVGGAVYCGVVEAQRHESSQPINVWFSLRSPLPPDLFATFGLTE